MNLKVLPAIAGSFPQRAAGLGMTAAGLVAALVWNDQVKPNRKLRALDAPARLVREPIGVSLRGPLRQLAEQRAREQQLSLNAYLEALMQAQLQRPAAPLVILYSHEKDPRALRLPRAVHQRGRR